MSNNMIDSSHTEEPEATWNIPHFFKFTVLVSSSIAFVLALSHVAKIKEKNLPKNTQPHILQAFVDNKETFQGLPIIRIGNIEEIHTLKQSGKSGWYIFEDGSTITYWKIELGTVESNTYTITQ